MKTGSTGTPVDRGEPEKVAQAAVAMGLTYVVLTMVDRDDLPDGGAFLTVARTVQPANIGWAAGPRPARGRARDGHEAGAKTLDTGEILVAGGLIDLPLAPKWCFERFHGNAIRLHGAIAATLADRLVDEGPAVGIGIGSALAPAAPFDGAVLVVHQYRYAF